MFTAYIFEDQCHFDITFLHLLQCTLTMLTSPSPKYFNTGKLQSWFIIACELLNYIMDLCQLINGC